MFGQFWFDLGKIKIFHHQKHSISYGYDQLYRFISFVFTLKVFLSQLGLSTIKVCLGKPFYLYFDHTLSPFLRPKRTCIQHMQSFPRNLATLLVVHGF